MSETIMTAEQQAEADALADADAAVETVETDVTEQEVSVSVEAEAERDSKLKEIATRVKDEVVKLYTILVEGGKQADSVALIVLEARLAIPWVHTSKADGMKFVGHDWKGDSQAYRDWYKGNIEMMLDAQAPKDENGLPDAATAKWIRLAKSAIRDSVRNQLGAFLIEHDLTSEAEAIGLDTRTNAERARATRAANTAAGGEAPSSKRGTSSNVEWVEQQVKMPEVSLEVVAGMIAAAATEFHVTRLHDPSILKDLPKQEIRAIVQHISKAQQHLDAIVNLFALVTDDTTVTEPNTGTVEGVPVPSPEAEAVPA